MDMSIDMNRSDGNKLITYNFYNNISVPIINLLLDILYYFNMHVMLLLIYRVKNTLLVRFD